MKTASEFMANLIAVCLDKPNKKGIRLQKRQYIAEYLNEIFTVTIERGDKLNKENV